jgi:hypothetical protein
MAAIVRNRAAILDPSEPFRKPYIVCLRPSPGRDEDLDITAESLTQISSHELERPHKSRVDDSQAVARFELAQPKVTLDWNAVTVPTKRDVVSHDLIVPHLRRLSHHEVADR